MAGGEITVSSFAAMYLCERLDLVPHPMLRVGQLPADATDDARRAASNKGLKDLQNAGLADQEDLEPVLEDAWSALARPPVAVGLAVHSRRGSDFNAVLVEQGRSVLRARQADGATARDIESIVLSRDTRSGLSSNTVEMIGALTSAEGASVSVPNSQLDEAGKRMSRGSGGMLQALRGAGIARDEAYVLNQAFGTPREFEGVVTVRSYDGRVRRMRKLPYNLQYFGTETGTYLMQTKPGRDGREWLTVAPTDSRKLASAVEEMVQAVKAPARV